MVARHLAAAVAWIVRTISIGVAVGVHLPRLDGVAPRVSFTGRGLGDVSKHGKESRRTAGVAIANVVTHVLVVRALRVADKPFGRVPDVATHADTRRPHPAHRDPRARAWGHR